MASLSLHEDSLDFFFKYVFRETCMKQSLLNLSKSKLDIILSIFIIFSFFLEVLIMLNMSMKINDRCCRNLRSWLTSRNESVDQVRCNWRLESIYFIYIIRWCGVKYYLNVGTGYKTVRFWLWAPLKCSGIECLILTILRYSTSFKCSLISL